MTSPLGDQLDELNQKIQKLIDAVKEGRLREQSLKVQLDKLDSDNRHLRQKLVTAQDQVKQMLDQWFPELDLNGEREHGNS